MCDGAEFPMVHFTAIRIGFGGADDVFEVEAERTGEVIAECGDAEFFGEFELRGLPDEVAGPDEVRLGRFDFAEEVVDGGDELAFRDLEQQAGGQEGFVVLAIFSAEEVCGAMGCTHADHGVEEEGIAGMTIGYGGDPECGADVFGKPGFAAGAGGNEGFVHSADDEVLAGFVEEFEPALDVDDAVGRGMAG